MTDQDGRDPQDVAREQERARQGIANQDQQNAPVTERTPQPDTTHFQDVPAGPEPAAAGDGQDAEEPEAAEAEAAQSAGKRSRGRR